jgi:hypothetical protein
VLQDLSRGGILKGVMETKLKPDVYEKTGKYEKSSGRFFVGIK